MKQLFNKNSMNPDLPGIIVSSHGPLAVSIVKSAQMIIGEMENITAFSLEEADDPEEFGNALMEMYQSYPEGSVIFVDIKGGTPFNQSMIQARRKKVKVNILCGASMPMLFAAVELRDSYRGEELIQQVKQQTVESLVDICRDWNE